MITVYSPTHAVLIGKASEVFAEIKFLAKWEAHGIGFKYFSLAVFELN